MHSELTDNDTYDAVIVGARCAGAATGMLLASAGLRVLVFDKARYGSDTLSTHALMRPAVLLLHRWGLTDRLEHAGTPRIRKTTFRYADHRGSEEISIDIRPRNGVM
jgi:2-polyprenyl-6-methoxyphenol hydroxylase-like FAD-dependent oxidoreductase